MIMEYFKITNEEKTIEFGEFMGEEDKIYIEHYTPNSTSFFWIDKQKCKELIEYLQNRLAEK
jgi:hypothetical protein